MSIRLAVNINDVGDDTIFSDNAVVKVEFEDSEEGIESGITQTLPMHVINEIKEKLVEFNDELQDFIIQEM